MHFLVYIGIALLAILLSCFVQASLFEVNPKDPDDFMPTLITSFIIGIFWPIAIPVLGTGVVGYKIIQRVSGKKK